MDAEKYDKMLIAFRCGDISADTKDLQDWLNSTHTPNEIIQLVAKRVEFELQRRQLLESIKWQKWVAIATGALAIATFILAIITYFKP